MKKRQALFLTLLAFITVLVVLLPVLFGYRFALGQQSKAWQYNPGSRTTVTAQQVAKLYENGELSEEPFSTAKASTAYHNTAVYLVNSVFQNNSLLPAVQTVLQSGAPNLCFEKTQLITVENKPTALRTVKLEYRNGLQSVTLLFEEKTQLLLLLIYNEIAYTTVDATAQDNNNLSLNNATDTYYGKLLQLPQKQYGAAGFVQKQGSSQNGNEAFYNTFMVLGLNCLVTDYCDKSESDETIVGLEKIYN